MLMPLETAQRSLVAGIAVVALVALLLSIPAPFESENATGFATGGIYEYFFDGDSGTFFIPEENESIETLGGETNSSLIVIMGDPNSAPEISGESEA
jgi:hypothetical protein